MLHCKDIGREDSVFSNLHNCILPGDVQEFETLLIRFKAQSEDRAVEMMLDNPYLVRILAPTLLDIGPSEG
jgi:hypothetical protein